MSDNPGPDVQPSDPQVDPGPVQPQPDQPVVMYPHGDSGAVSPPDPAKQETADSNQAAG